MSADTKNAGNLHIAVGDDDIKFRHPSREDGQAVNEMISETGVLDENSLYCNFLQCSHFSTTCMLAEMDGKVVGWVSGYRQPEHPHSLFIWQVAVSEAARGKGLARRMIRHLLRGPGCEGVNKIRTTITPSNESSWRMFGSLAEELDAPMHDNVWLHEDKHFDGEHDSEHMLTIGPFGVDAEGSGEDRGPDIDPNPAGKVAA